MSAIPPFARPDGRPEPPPTSGPTPVAGFPPAEVAPGAVPPPPPAGPYPPAGSYLPPGPYPPAGAYPPGQYLPPAPHPPGWPAPGALGPPRPAARRGLGPTGITAIVIVAVLFVGGAIGWLLTDRARAPLGEVTVATSAWVGALGTGHCVAELPADGAVSRVTVVPCAGPHQAEVLSTRSPSGTASSGTAFPGTAELAGLVAGGCEMDRTQAELGFRPVVWTPSEGAWRLDRTASLCLAALPSGTATGSFTAGDEVALD